MPTDGSAGYAVSARRVLMLAAIVALAVGATLLGSALVPFLPAFRRVAPDDHRWVDAIALGLGLVTFAAVAAAVAVAARPSAARPSSAARAPSGDAEAAAAETTGAYTVGRLELAVAGAVPLAIALAQAARHLHRLAHPSAVGSAVVVSQVVAGLAVAIVLPVALALAAGSRARPYGKRADGRRDVVVLAVLVVAVVGAVLAAVAQRVVLGWDESVYALLARHLLTGAPDTGWAISRPPGLSIVAVVPVALGGDEAGLRVPVALSSGLFLAATWWLGRSIHSTWAGLLAAALVGAGRAFQIDAGFLLNDVPATAALLLVLATVWRVFEAPRIGWSGLWLAPLAALAFYLRYGSAPVLIAIVVVTVVLWPRSVLAGWRPLAATVGLFVLLVLPHLVISTLATGTPWGIVLLAGEVVRRVPLNEAVATTLSWLPDHLSGLLAAIVVVIGWGMGVGLVARAVARQRLDRAARAAILLVVPSLVPIAVVLAGPLLPDDPRLFFLPLACLLVLGSAGVVRCADAVDVAVSRALPASQMGAFAAAVVAVVVSGALVVSLVGLPGAVVQRRASVEWIRTAGATIRAASPGSCAVLAADIPAITWYSGCPTTGFDLHGAPISRQVAALDGSGRWLVVRADNQNQPDPAGLAAFTTGRTAAAIYRSAGGKRLAELFRIE